MQSLATGRPFHVHYLVGGGRGMGVSLEALTEEAVLSNIYRGKKMTASGIVVGR